MQMVKLCRRFEDVSHVKLRRKINQIRSKNIGNRKRHKTPVGEATWCVPYVITVTMQYRFSDYLQEYYELSYEATNIQRLTRVVSTMFLNNLLLALLPRENALLGHKHFLSDRHRFNGCSRSQNISHTVMNSAANGTLLGYKQKCEGDYLLGCCAVY